MSAKARRSNAWDDQHLRGPFLWPVRALLKAFSSITLAVMLLSFVMLYGISASVPVGMLALIPTWLVYSAAFVLLVGVSAGAPAVVVRKLGAGAHPASRFVLVFSTLLIFAAVGVWVWMRWVWPALHFDPVTGKGLRLFAPFVEAYKSTTLRRLPWIEMSELEYYSWWPLRWVLLLFVVNMVVATVRRIEFNFKNVGVLTVHTGIVVIALGSIYYAGLKQEGDTILLAGAPGPDGKPALGPPQQAFYDNTRVALFVNPGRMGWEQRPLTDVPRYNDYNLDAAAGELASVVGRWQKSTARAGRVLDLPALPPANSMVPPDVSLRVVGYAAYAEPMTDYRKVEADHAGAGPLRFVYLYSNLPEADGTVSTDPAFAFTFPARTPADRHTGNDAFAIEYTMGPDAGMTDDRWRDLSEPLPDGTEHALVVEVPAAEGRPAHRGVYPVQHGTAFPVGETGFRIGVKELSPTPTFPIITPGYRGATSSVAVVQITPPTGEPYERFIYHRYPELNQDILPTVNAQGMPTRRDADPSIRVSLIEADRVYAYIDESAGVTRAIVRRPGGQVRVLDSIADGERFEIVPQVFLRAGERWEHAVKVERPRPVPPQRQEKQFVGTHDKGMLGVEVTATGQGKDYREVVWLPFTRFLTVMSGTERRVTLPDGRTLDLAFGRLQRPLPGFELRLVDFEMIAYDHRGAPRDYQSIVRVTPRGARFDPFTHITKLNEPLQAPFHWDDGQAWIVNLPGRLAAGMNPHQFKFSQAGWDQSGWQRTQAQADRGEAKRAFASFTILGVGNNPGIHLIALGSVMMGVGIPWAFYLKPWLVRREKLKIQEQLAAGTYRKPARETVAV
jgi:hypothetical protein